MCTLFHADPVAGMKCYARCEYSVLVFTLCINTWLYQISSSPVAESWKQQPDTTTTCVWEKRRDKMALRECALELRLFPRDQNELGRGPARAQTAQNRWRKSLHTISSKPVLLLSLLLWGGDWSHGEEGLCGGSPGSMGGGCCGYSMGLCVQTMQREIGVGVSVIKACFLENNFCFTWDILGLVLGINF